MQHLLAHSHDRRGFKSALKKETRFTVFWILIVLQVFQIIYIYSIYRVCYVVVLLFDVSFSK